MRRILFWTCIVIVAIGAAAFVALGCGTERWSVKTSSDQDAARVNMTPILSTVADLNNITPPTRAQLDAKPNSRFPEELHVFTVRAYLDGFKLEADGDFHIGLIDLDNPHSTMVAEMISENCAPALRNESAMLRASWQVRFGEATTKKFKKVGGRVKIEITGVGFFDFIHGQTDVAKNGFELHRVIAWKEIIDGP